jgi:AcrR family transcriptional regulator
MTPTKRLPAKKRHEFLLAEARNLVREEGADALTLITLAKRAGVTKPITYRHFGNREGLLLSLYRQFDDDQMQAMDAALERTSKDLAETARVVAASFVDCALSAGTELSWLVSALQTSPALNSFWKQCRERHTVRVAEIFQPFAQAPLTKPSLLVLMGASDTLSEAATASIITRHEAITALAATMVNLVSSSAEE